ncbi:MAG TPA: EamA family transporter, partial [Limnochordales bacterium]
MSALGLAVLGALCWGLAPVAGKIGLAAVDPVVGLLLRTLIASAVVVGFVAGSGAWPHLERVPVGA